MMAGEKKTEQSEPVAAGLTSDICTNLVEQELASRKDGIPSDMTSAESYSGDVTSPIKCETDQELVAEEGFYGTCHKLDDHGYLNAGGGSHTGIQSENGLLLPGYNPYATGTFRGVDRQQPYVSSSGYLQHPDLYGSDYSWDSTYVGDVTNGTTAMRGSVKSALGSNVSVKSNGFNSQKPNYVLESKTSTLPLDMKWRQSSPSSNFSKPIHHTQPVKQLNKLGSGFQSSSPVKMFQPVGKFSSVNYQNQGWLAHDSPLNCRPNGRNWNGNERFMLSEKFNRNGEFEASTELTRGPRAHNRSNPLNSSAGDERLGFSIRKDQYNLDNFQIKYDNAKFYVIKSYSEDDIHKCIKYDVWSSTPNGNKKLDAAFHDAEAKASETGTKCPIFLFFSVNGSGQFVGLAEMIGRVDFNKNMDFWQLDKWNGFFPVKWHIIKDIPNIQLRHIILENNDNRPVTHTRDTQEIGLEQGLEMVNIFKSYSGNTSMLDDFNFYGNREKSLKAKRSRMKDIQTERYENNDFSTRVKAGERIVEDGSLPTGSSSDPTPSLLNLTRNLSLYPHPLKSSAVMNPRDNSVKSISASDQRHFRN